MEEKVLQIFQTIRNKNVMEDLFSSDGVFNANVQLFSNIAKTIKKDEVIKLATELASASRSEREKEFAERINGSALNRGRQGNLRTRLRLDYTKEMDIQYEIEIIKDELAKKYGISTPETVEKDVTYVTRENDHDNPKGSYNVAVTGETLFVPSDATLSIDPDTNTTNVTRHYTPPKKTKNSSRETVIIGNINNFEDLREWIINKGKSMNISPEIIAKFEAYKDPSIVLSKDNEREI